MSASKPQQKITSRFNSFTITKKSRALLVLLSLVAPHAHAAYREAAPHFRGLGPDAGGVSVLGLRARYEFIEATVQSFENSGLSYSIAAMKDLYASSQSDLRPSIGAALTSKNEEFLLGARISLKYILFHPLGSDMGIRIDNDINYGLSAKTMSTDYYLGFTIAWK